MRHVVMDFTVRPDDLIADCRLRSVIFYFKFESGVELYELDGLFGLFW